MRDLFLTRVSAFEIYIIDIYSENGRIMDFEGSNVDAYPHFQCDPYITAKRSCKPFLGI